MAAMSDRELLDRIRSVGRELDELIEGAAFNSKYHTKTILHRARRDMEEAAAGLAWHVQEPTP